MTTLVIILSALLLTAPAEPAPEGELTPLSAEDRAAFDAIEPDPLPKKLTRNLHFVVSDERHHYNFREALRDLGGVFIGIGTHQNFAMAAWARAELLVLVDFDQMVIDTHKAYRAAFLRAPDPAAFIELWSKDQATELEAAIAATWTDEADRAGALRGHRYSRQKVYDRLRQVRRLWVEAEQPSFLSSEDDYDHLVRLYRADRVVFVRGDLTREGALVSLASALADQGREVSAFYLSNTEQYFDWVPEFRANLRAFPTTERSLVLRTRAWRPTVPDGKKGKLYYAYHTQAFGLFRRWLDDPGARRVHAMLPWSAKVKNALYELAAEPKGPTTR